ncbi:epithelial discoidin domain-containing receptor 1-like [Pocillopora damicornis]|uniref:epithelial discoidin domain-containing receptor 1-like n=1 Tax=Pocillopora damicornis TaxID=46731 RepID=UPI000F553A44|nr:epithelial discoidin domain-containing receptor 1-like [Pocillopora damicornis]
MVRIHLVIGCFNVLCFGQDIPQDCFSPLGMEDGGIRDIDIRATSSLNASASAIHGRLNHIGGYGGWCPDQQPYYNGTGPIHKEFIQVEFPRPFRIKGIITQPRARGVEGIRRFLVSYRQDQENNEKYAWLYDGRSHKHRFFQGNSLSELKPPLVADGIRIIPEICPRRQVCLRFELLGCQIEGAIVTYKMLQGNSLDGRYNFTDSSYDGLTEGRFLFFGLGMLTDGRLANEDLTVNNGLGWIGWNMIETPKPYIIFDFLNKRIFISATFHCNVKDQTHIELFSRVEIRFDKTMWNGSPPDLMQEPREISFPSSSSINRNVTIDLCRRVGKSVRFNFTYRGQWILISEVIFNSGVSNKEPLGGRSPPAVYCVSSTTHSRYTSSTSEYSTSTLSSTTSTETTVAPSAEGPDWVMLISSLTVLFVIVVILGIAWSFRRKRRQKKDTEESARDEYEEIEFMAALAPFSREFGAIK